jgi:biotin carboxylase
MGSLNIYFNRTYATNAQIIAMLRANPDRRPVRIFGTHVDPTSPVLAACDEAYAEPEPDVTGAAYVEWALEFTVRHGIDVFIPRLEMVALAGARARFAAQGVALLSAPADVVELFDDKAATYAIATAHGLAVPPYRVVDDPDALLCAYAEILDEAGSACIKPVTGVGGDGFRILIGQDPGLADVMGPLTPVVGVHAVARAIDAAILAGEPVAPMMVLPYLPGPEISVDLLADPDGKPLAAIGRAKTGRLRSIVNDEAAREIAETLVQAHRVSYLSNTQVRYWQGPHDAEPLPYLLEVNTRISGGLFQTSLAGVNLPWAAVQIALGEEPTIGDVQYDVVYTVAQTLEPVSDAARSVPE